MKKPVHKACDIHDGCLVVWTETDKQEHCPVCAMEVELSEFRAGVERLRRFNDNQREMIENLERKLKLRSKINGPVHEAIQLIMDARHALVKVVDDNEEE